MIKKLSFIFAILGISLLLLLMLKYPKQITIDQVDNYEINTKIQITGKVNNVRIFDDFQILSIENIDLVCNCKENYLNKEVSVVGLIDDYKGTKQIVVLKIEEA